MEICEQGERTRVIVWPDPGGVGDVAPDMLGSNQRVKIFRRFSLPLAPTTRSVRVVGETPLTRDFFFVRQNGP